MAEYPSFESVTGTVVDRAEANSRYLTNQGAFDETTSPPLSDVHAFAANAYYFVCGKMLAAGFGTTPANATVRGILTEIQALDTSVQVEQSQPFDEKGEANLRYRGFAKRRDEMIDTFLTQRVLDDLGQASSGKGDLSEFLELTGRSVSRSDTIYADSDIWQPRFPRGYQDKKVGSGTGEGDE